MKTMNRRFASDATNDGRTSWGAVATGGRILAVNWIVAGLEIAALADGPAPLGWGLALLGLVSLPAIGAALRWGAKPGTAAGRPFWSICLRGYPNTAAGRTGLGIFLASLGALATFAVLVKAFHVFALSLIAGVTLIVVGVVWILVMTSVESIRAFRSMEPDIRRELERQSGEAGRERDGGPS